MSFYPAAVLLLALECCTFAHFPAPLSASDPVRDTADRAVVDAVLDQTCGKRIVLLGESSHGDGETIAFKSRIVQALIHRCGFNAVFFESSFYDFARLTALRDVGQPTTVDMLSSAIGGIWNRDAEMQPLIRFLHRAHADDNVQLGGLDNNLGSAGAFYSLDEMPSDLTRGLGEAEGAECQERLRRRIYQDYPADRPYTIDDRRSLRSCLSHILRLGTREYARRSLSSDRQQMLRNVGSYLDSDFSTASTAHAFRDAAMFSNLSWLTQRLPRHSKIIVWGATVHMAKSTRASREFNAVLNLGAQVHRTYGSSAYHLGFSAAAGSYRLSHVAGVRDLPDAPAASIEARAIARTDADRIFLNRSMLVSEHVRPAAFFSHEFANDHWSDTLDGAVIFRRERPPGTLVRAPDR